MNKYQSAHGLGRGLSALLGDIDDENRTLTAEVQHEGDVVTEISLNDIDTDLEQPRKSFNDDTLQELADSIASVGVIQPIVLVKSDNGRYKIVVGERRFRASRMAGRTTIPAIIRNWDEMTRLKSALIENLQREDLNPVDTATGIKALMEKCRLTQEEVAAVVGKSRSAIANTLRLLTLPNAVLEMLRDGRLSAGHARALVTVDDEKAIKLANQVIQQGLSVRQLEHIVTKPDTAAPAAKKDRIPELVKLEDMVRQVFAVKVRIEGDQSKGKLILNYSKPEELEKIWELLETFNEG